jgi:hypothetical protein
MSAEQTSKCDGLVPPNGHIFEVFKAGSLGMLGIVWSLRCVKCKVEIGAMTAVEFLMSGTFNKQEKK